MKKLLKRMTAALLAGFLVLGALPSLAPMQAKAAETTEITYAADELTLQWASAGTAKEDGKWKISFRNQYDQIKLTIPEAINMGNCTEVRFNVADQTVPVALKLWVGSEESERQVLYGQEGAEEYAVTPSISDTIDVVGIMENTNASSLPGDAAISLLSVTFVMGEGGNTAGETTTAPADSSSKSEPAKLMDLSGLNLGENLIENGNFEEADTSMWGVELKKSEISSEKADEAIFDEVKTYGKIARTPEKSITADCFAQDITDKVENNAEYAFEFYAKLSESYEGAPEGERKVAFAPYVVSEGETTYYGSYSAEMAGTNIQALEPGVWTRYTGTFKMPGTALDKVVVRFLEEGTDYGTGDCVLGDYYVTGISLRKVEKEKAVIEKDVPDMWKAVVKDLGEDAKVSATIGVPALSDDVLLELVTKHFNSYTVENELKNDALLGGSGSCKGKETVTFNGEELLVPQLHFAKADKVLDWALAWNEANPNHPFKTRGHVMLWHSQCPEWFFHEDYVASNDYVSKEVMDKRLEWYFATVLGHYVGEDSPYKDLFYGWDIVNEAINEQGNDRTDEEPGDDKLSDSTHGNKSSWYHIYQSDEYVINAFKYANKYAPETLDLYYNDYNECTPSKREGIIRLLKEIQATEGARVDAMGMQGHYDLSYPSLDQFEKSLQEYGEVVDKVMITEWDLKASSSYDGTEETRAAEYARQAKRYNDLYNIMVKAEKDGVVNVDGFVMWGVLDGQSWLQSFSGVGGGADGKKSQCPLLFDDDYKVKPAFWAFVDPSKIEKVAGEEIPAEKPYTMIEQGTVTVDGELDAAWETATAVPLEVRLGAKADATVRMLWDAENLYVYAEVKDAELNADNGEVHQKDSLEVFIDENNAKNTSYEEDDKQYRINYLNEHSFNGAKCLEENMKSAVKETEDGYIVEASFKWTDITPALEMEIGLELQINDADGSGKRIGTLSWYDETGTCYNDPSKMGVAQLVGGESAPVEEPVAAEAVEKKSGAPVVLVILAVIVAGAVAVVYAKKGKK